MCIDASVGENGSDCCNFDDDDNSDDVIMPRRKMIVIIRTVRITLLRTIDSEHADDPGIFVGNLVHNPVVVVVIVTSMR